MGTTRTSPGAKAGILSTALAVLLASGAAHAQAVSLTGTLSENITFTDNFALAGSSAGTTMSSVTNFSLAFRTSNQTSSFSLFGGTDLVYRSDPGGGSDTSGFNPRISANYSVTGQTTTFSLGANYSDAPINFQTADPLIIVLPGGTNSLITSTANQVKFGANVNMSHQINATNALSGGVSYSDTNYDTSDPALVDFSATTATLSYSHDFDASLSGSLDLRYGIFSSDAAGQDSTATSLGVSATWQRTNNISLNGDFNLAFISEDAAADSTDVVGSLGIDYALPTGSLSATLSHRILPGSGGELLQSTSIGVNGTYDINTSSRLSLDIDYTEDDTLAGGSESKVLTISPRYSIDLTSSVTVSAMYTLKNADFGSGSATSHGISLKLVKNFDLLP